MANADRIIELLHEAKARPAGAERKRFLAEACGDNAALEEQIVSLLEVDADEGASDFLRRTRIIRQPTLVTEKPGDRIGRYKLLEQIGEGGCGVVYMAEQEEPVRRRVALKVIKLGMDTKQVIARFEAERQALAMMDHPNIAKVLDAGATDTGRPFFVMELVRGVKMTDYCDQNNLSTHERLELFMQVCQAIQHAHQKGIIHRDIKPSNILVTQHDDVAVPKVIDFGIAKATIGPLTDKTLFTAFAQFMGTPAYMSPEQAQLSGLDVDTRADIYSLGVLLYELLTGNTPFDAKELLAAGMDEMRRRIREEEPAKPSTCLSTMQAMDLTTVARRRHVEPPKLIHLIRGDLDWLVMKCLEKDRTRRYDTANGLAMDIQRHLSNEPVIARPPSSGYRFQKLVRRNKLAFAAASAVTAALVMGLGISMVMFFKAQGEKKKAQTEAAKATAISDFLQQLLRSANPDALKGSDYTVRQLLDDFSAGLGSQLENQPEVEATVRATIGRAYYRLGVADKARAQQERALSLRRRLFGNQSEQVAESLVDYAWACFEQQQYAKGETHVREALDIYHKRDAGGQPVISALWVLQKLFSAQGRYPEVDAVTDEALAIAGKSPGVEFSELASMIHGLAEAKIRQSKYDDAAILALRAVEMHRRLRGNEHLETAWALVSMGSALRGQQKLIEAEAALREALRIFRKYYSPGHKSVDGAMAELKLVLKARGDTPGLEALARLGLNEANQRIERYNADTEAWIERANAHVDLNLREAAQEDYAKAIASSPDDPVLRSQLAELLRVQGKWAEAERVLCGALALQRKSFGNEHPDVATSLSSLSFLLRQQGKLPEAESTGREALAICRKLFGNEHPSVAYALHPLAWDLNSQGKRTEAEALSREEVALWRKLLGNEHPNVAWALGDLTLFLRDQKKLLEAEITIRESLAIRRKAFGNEHPDVIASFNLLSNLLREQGKLTEMQKWLRETMDLIPGDTNASQRTAVGMAWLDLARSAFATNQYEFAERASQQAIALFKQLVQENLHEAAYPLHLGHSRWQLGEALQNTGRPDLAGRAFLEALQVFEKGTRDFPAEPFFRQEQAFSHRFLASVANAAGRIDEAERHYRSAMELYAALADEVPQHTLYSQEEAYTTWCLAGILDRAGRIDPAATNYHQAVVLYEKAIVNFPTNAELRSHLIGSYDSLAVFLNSQGKTNEAWEATRKSQTVAKELSGK